MDGEKPPAFQFYARDYLTSLAVSAMTPEERGGYVHLLCYAWLQDEPGTLPADDAILARLSELHARWPECRTAILRAWRETTRSGVPVLVQSRMVLEREAQHRRAQVAAKGARTTNARRWGSIANDSLSDRSSVALHLQSASATAVEPESKSPVVHAQTDLLSPPPTPRPILTLPLRDGAEFAITASMVARWDRAFPDVLVTTTLREMLAWLEANPGRRKTARGALRFVTGWLLREQEKASSKEAHRGHQNR